MRRSVVVLLGVMMVAVTPSAAGSSVVIQETWMMSPSVHGDGDVVVEHFIAYDRHAAVASTDPIDVATGEGRAIVCGSALRQTFSSDGLVWELESQGGCGYGERVQHLPGGEVGITTEFIADVVLRRATRASTDTDFGFPQEISRIRQLISFDTVWSPGSSLEPTDPSVGGGTDVAWAEVGWERSASVGGVIEFHGMTFSAQLEHSRETGTLFSRIMVDAEI